MGDSVVLRMKAKNRFQRATQIVKWLKTEFKLDSLKRLEWVDILVDDDGKSQLCGCIEEESNGDLTITLSKRACSTTQVTIDTVIHEAAHAALWDTGLGMLHGDKFWKRYGRMMDAYEHHGYMDSKAFDPE